MARRIGAHFLQAAHGPLAFAASCIAQNQILKGIEELAPGGLAGGLLRGVNDVAAEAGVPPREVQSLLPWGELARAAKRLEATQPAALRAWKIHAGAYGFLDLVTQLTVDGRPIDVRQGLTRLAAKVRADEALAEPLAALAVAAGAWEELVLRCGALLEDGEGLARAFHLRRRRRIAAGAVAVSVMSIAIGVIAWTALARARVAGVLAEADPCAAHGIASSDRELASNEQDRAIGDAERRCAAVRASEAEARARAEREAEERAREAREAAAREARCRALAAELAGPADGGTAASGASGGLPARIANRRLAVGDLGPEEPILACWTDPSAPVEARRAIDRAFVDALLAMPEWAGVIDPSPRVAALLEAHQGRIPGWQLAALADRARRTADASLVAGRHEDVLQARRLCALSGRLGRPGGTPCSAVDAVATR